MKTLEKEKIYQIFLLVMFCVILGVSCTFRGVRDRSSSPNQIKYQEKVPEKILLQGGKIYLNNANKYEFMALPGIGPKRAVSILHYRKKHGKFENIEELSKIRGISKGVLDQIRPYVVVRISQNQNDE